jgi:hypothetical protein
LGATLACRLPLTSSTALAHPAAANAWFFHEFGCDHPFCSWLPKCQKVQVVKGKRGGWNGRLD